MSLTAPARVPEFSSQDVTAEAICGTLQVLSIRADLAGTIELSASQMRAILDAHRLAVNNAAIDGCTPRTRIAGLSG